MMKSSDRQKRQDFRQEILATEYGKQKLNGYAGSFREIASLIRPQQAACVGNTDRRELFYRYKGNEYRNVAADQIMAMADIMNHLAGEVFSYRPFSGATLFRLRSVLKREGIEAFGGFYAEDRDYGLQVGIRMKPANGTNPETERVAALLSPVLKERLIPAQEMPVRMESGSREYWFVKEPRFVFLTGAAGVVKEQERESGDNYGFLDPVPGRLVVMLSDGMGSGEDACRDSDRVLDLTERLLETGYDTADAVSVLGKALYLSSEEGREEKLTALDLCEINLYNGECTFTKAGAAASYIRRGHMVERISADSMPLGAMPEFAGSRVVREIRSGDSIFLLSDGICDAMAECMDRRDLGEIIGELKYESPQPAAELLLQEVIAGTGGRIRDDMTVVVVGIYDESGDISSISCGRDSRGGLLFG